MTTSSTEIVTPPSLLDTAKEIYREIQTRELTLRRSSNDLLLMAHKLGGVLCELKSAVGPGRWLFWLGANWTEMGERNAQRCMALYKDNPEATQVEELSQDSVRKFLWGYIPAKDRPQLEGDERIPQVPHVLTFVNNFYKWDRRAQVGLADRPPVDELRRDLEPVVRRIAELVGKDWIEELIS